MSGRKSLKKGNNIFYSVLAGALISALSMLIFSAVAAIITNMTADPLTAIPTASFISMILGAAVSGFIVSKRSPEGKMLITALSSLLFCLMLLLIGLILSGGAVPGKAFLNYICYIGIALIFAKIGAREKRRHR